MAPPRHTQTRTHARTHTHTHIQSPTHIHTSNPLRHRTATTCDVWQTALRFIHARSMWHHCSYQKKRPRSDPRTGQAHSMKIGAKLCSHMFKTRLVCVAADRCNINYTRRKVEVNNDVIFRNKNLIRFSKRYFHKMFKCVSCAHSSCANAGV